MAVHTETISIAVLKHRRQAGDGIGELKSRPSQGFNLCKGCAGICMSRWRKGPVLCDPRKNASMKEDNKSDKIDARRLAELLRMDSS